jgi:hypothetical protein
VQTTIRATNISSLHIASCLWRNGERQSAGVANHASYVANLVHVVVRTLAQIVCTLALCDSVRYWLRDESHAIWVPKGMVRRNAEVEDEGRLVLAHSRKVGMLIGG